MGVNASRGARPSKANAPATPRFASIYHSWLGYIGFSWQFVYGLVALTMVTGFFETSSTATLLALEVVTLVGYMTLFWLNSAWYSVTFTSRRYFKIDLNECMPIICEPPTYDKVTERDAKFHNDQWHFSVVLKAHTFVLIFLIAVLATAGTANPSPDFNTLPAVYDAYASKMYRVIGFFQAAVIGIAAICGVIMLETHSCLIHTSLVAINDDLVSGTFNLNGKGLRPNAEMNNQPGQLTNVLTDKGPVTTGTGAYARVFI